MEPPSSNNGKHHFFPLSHHKSGSSSCSLLFFKLILCSLFLLALPLFSSRPPQTQQSTLLTHFWELLHLLFIGIAVSYGLFSRKNANFPISDSSPQLDHSLSDWSTMFHDSPNGYGETNVIQTWNSQCNQTQSVVVVADAYKSLGLPVRSLKSTLSDSSDRRRNRRFGDLGPTQFNENDEALPSPISWRSRSGRMEVTEKISAAPIRPLSVDEAQFESLKSRPFHFQSKAPSFSQTSSKMEDLRYKKMEASFAIPAAAHSNSVSFEFLSNSNMEDLRYNKMEMRDEMDTATIHAHFRPPSVDETDCESHNSESFPSEASYATSLYSSSSSSNNHSPLHSINSSELPESNIQEQFESFKSRPFQSKPSYSPSHSSSERELSGSEREFVSRNKKRFLNSVKPARKPPLRGKSVRTIRSQSKTADARNCREGYRNCVPNPTFPRNQKSEKHKANVESEEEEEEEMVSCDGNCKESSGEVEEQIVGKIESDEVDKKASEFIAKFREQIRLQKSASVDISGELNINDDYFR